MQLKKNILAFAVCLGVMLSMSISAFAAPGDAIDLRPLIGTNGNYESKYDRTDYIFNATSDKFSAFPVFFSRHSVWDDIEPTFPALVAGDAYRLRISCTYSPLSVVDFSVLICGSSFSFSNNSYFERTDESFDFVCDFVSSVNGEHWIGNVGYFISSPTLQSFVTYSVFSVEALTDSYVIKPTYLDSFGTISPSINTSVQRGMSQTFTITPKNGYRIKDVKVDGVSVGAVSSYTFEDVQAHGEISADFEALPSYTITPSAGTGGNIIPSLSINVPKGDSQTYTFTPNAGYRIKDVIVDNVSIGAVSSYTFENVQSACFISVEFEPVSSSIPGFVLDSSLFSGFIGGFQDLIFLLCKIGFGIFSSMFLVRLFISLMRRFTT